MATVKLGYVIAYVPDVLAAVAFYERAFGLKQQMLFGTEYAELATGATVLGFVSEDMRARNGFATVDNRPAPALPAGIEIAFVTDDVDAAHAKALAEGAALVAAPEKKPWGQTVSYVRDLNGVLIELCSPMAPPGGDAPDTAATATPAPPAASEEDAAGNSGTGTPNKRARSDDDADAAAAAHSEHK